MRPRPATLLLALLLCASRAWTAERPEETAISRLAGEIASQVSSSAEPPLAVYVRASVPELSRGFSTLLLAELSSRRLAPLSLSVADELTAERKAREEGARSLLRLTLRLEDGKLSARGDLLSTWVNFWSGQAPTRAPIPAAALEARVEADAHALALAASMRPTPAPASSPLRLFGATFAPLPSRPAAISAGDLDADGTDEVAVLTDEEVLLFSPQGKLLARYEHRTLPGALSPCREPFGAIAVQKSPPRLAYFSAQRSRGELLAYDGGVLKAVGVLEQALLGAAVEPLSGTLMPGLNTFEPQLTLGGKARLRLKAPFSSLAAHRRAPSLYLFFSPEGGASLVKGESELLRLGGAGAGGALCDVDGDGQLELLLSSARYAPEPDELRLVSLAAVEAHQGKALPPLWEGSSLRGQVLQATQADLDGDGADELVLGVWRSDGGGELQVLRRAP